MQTFYALAEHLGDLLDSDPVEAIRQARQIGLNGPDRQKLTNLRASILVDGGKLTRQRDALAEGLALFRNLHELHPNNNIAYNLANAITAIIGNPPHDSTWLDYQEKTRQQRSEARKWYWKVAHDRSAEPSLRTQAWTNLGLQFSNSFRLGEAHDAWRAALEIDPENGVAAASAAKNLLWLYENGGCSDLTRIEAIMLARVALRNQKKIIEYAGKRAAEQIALFANEAFDPPARSPHKDPFVRWIERERLTLAPVVELVDPALGKLDWIKLPSITERWMSSGGLPPPIFAMFNSLKSDFILARDLVWRAIADNPWPSTGNYADTLDYAVYGPASSALVVAHRSALDLLDKIAVTANHYFELGLSPDKIYFGKLWRGHPEKGTNIRRLTKGVEKAIRGKVSALYGLVELAEDYDSKDGILSAQKVLRNAGTHRFVVLHDMGSPNHARSASEIEHHHQADFVRDVVRALRVTRSAIQMLVLAISHHEQSIAPRSPGLAVSMVVPDHDWIRGRDEQP